MEDLGGNKYGRKMKLLLTKGHGGAGRLHKVFLSTTERKLHNKNVFRDITEYEDALEDEDNKITNQDNTSFYQMVDVEDAIQQSLCQQILL